MYAWIRQLLFLFDAEGIHKSTFRILNIATSIPLLKGLIYQLYGRVVNKPVQVMGLTFKHPLGLAAGFDKDAVLGERWRYLGFSFVEVGTVTPKPQPGNEKPRLFRLPEDKALINRMGFNNKGVEYAVKRLKNRNKSIVIGGNIGKNKVTLNAEAVDDYVFSFQALYYYVDYFVVNVSSPNTPGLRELQDVDALGEILDMLILIRGQKQNSKPILLKIAPDLSEEQIKSIAALVNKREIEGVVATNTTISRENLTTSQELIDEIGAGGLSGAPVFEKSLNVVKMLRQELSKEKVIIGVGGISTYQQAAAMLAAGANLIQSYSGFIYKGPLFVRSIINNL